jgi:NAD(P)-dependent dehydrogenase (short-subunit alcohol dehydrogenase family)
VTFSQFFGKFMVEKKHQGIIVNMSSVSGMEGSSDAIRIIKSCNIGQPAGWSYVPPELVQQYDALKRQLAMENQHDREAYTDAKTDFVQNVLDAGPS